MGLLGFCCHALVDEGDTLTGILNLQILLWEGMFMLHWAQSMNEYSLMPLTLTEYQTSNRAYAHLCSVDA